MVNIDCDDVLIQYQNPELIHSGGQRVVYKIDHPKYGNVILKVGRYPTPDNSDGWDIKRIEQEIEILKHIDSPYYPKNLDFKKINGGRYVILEEYIKSLPLSKSFDKFETPLKTMKFTKNLVSGLKIIWDRNIVHRDLKPDNILIPSSEIPIIIDLGIARNLDDKSITKFFAQGPCTPCYAAPELLRYNKKLIDPRTDQFNVGIILLQLLLKGTHPFDPSLVGGDTIPENILDNNWFRQMFVDNKDLLPIFPVAKKMLGHERFQRYRTYEMLMRDVDICIGEFV